VASKLIQQSRQRLAKAPEDDPALPASRQAAAAPAGAAPDAPPLPADQPPAAPGAFPAGAVPAPHSPTGHGQLSDSEEADLAVCEAALDNLRTAFTAAGKALAVIQAGRLYRATHDTFDDYVEQRWGIGKSQAYRLIEAWPLAERLSPIGERLTESHVRELLPLAGRHGQDAAATVYQTVQEADGVRVTAAILHEVVAILPPDYFDPAETVRQILAYLAGDRTPPTPTAADPVTAFARVDRAISKLENDVIEAVRAEDPELVSRMAARMRAVLDQLERGPSA
jgi:hypothetical protein